MSERPEFCPCEDGKPDPCPACGATVSGRDKVHGRCQARRVEVYEPPVKVVLVHKDTGKEV